MLYYKLESGRKLSETSQGPKTGIVNPRPWQSVKGEGLTKNLEMPVSYFDQIAKPEQGRFADK